MSSAPSDEAELDRLRRDYRALLARLDSSQRDFNRLARSVYRVQEEERRRLARDLHDGLGQNLTAMVHQLGMLIDALDADALAPRRLAEQVLQTCRDSLEDTRQLSRLLRPQILDDLGLAPALRWLARWLGDTAGVPVRLAIDGLPALDAELQTVVFRVVQEALTNAIRHARAGEVRVEIGRRGGMLDIRVEDDGVGLGGAVDSIAAGGLGGLRERLRLFGGELALSPVEPHGLRLRALLPLDADHPGERE